LMLATESWCELLHRTVPLERLYDCYIFAMKRRSSTFPLAVTELLEAWRIISAEDAAKKRPTCTLCYGQGVALVYSPTRDEEYVKECPYCYGKVITAMAKVIDEEVV
jgi:hypothetical protein